MSKEKFLELLKDLQQVVELDDSFEGYIRYEAGERHEFEVEGFYRVGNSMGQGGSRIIESTH